MFLCTCLCLYLRMSFKDTTCFNYPLSRNASLLAQQSAMCEQIYHPVWRTLTAYHAPVALRPPSVWTYLNAAEHRLIKLILSTHKRHFLYLLTSISKGNRLREAAQNNIKITSARMYSYCLFNVDSYSLAILWIATELKWAEKSWNYSSVGYTVIRLPAFIGGSPFRQKKGLFLLLASMLIVFFDVCQEPYGWMSSLEMLLSLRIRSNECKINI